MVGVLRAPLSCKGRLQVCSCSGRLRSVQDAMLPASAHPLAESAPRRVKAVEALDVLVRKPPASTDFVTNHACMNAAAPPAGASTELSRESRSWQTVGHSQLDSRMPALGGRSVQTTFVSSSTAGQSHIEVHSQDVSSRMPPARAVGSKNQEIVLLSMNGSMNHKRPGRSGDAYCHITACHVASNVPAEPPSQSGQRGPIGSSRFSSGSRYGLSLRALFVALLLLLPAASEAICCDGYQNSTKQPAGTVTHFHLLYNPILLYALRCHTILY